LSLSISYPRNRSFIGADNSGYQRRVDTGKLKMAALVAAMRVVFRYAGIGRMGSISAVRPDLGVK